jgi:hypothetical protein
VHPQLAPASSTGVSIRECSSLRSISPEQANASHRSPRSRPGARWPVGETRLGLHLVQFAESVRRLGWSNRLQSRMTERSCFRATRTPVARTNSGAIETAAAAVIVASSPAEATRELQLVLDPDFLQLGAKSPALFFRWEGRTGSR